MMKRNFKNLGLLAIAIAATGTLVAACSGDDDDDGGSGGRPVVTKDDGSPADFASCTTLTGSSGSISVKVRIGTQGLDTSIPTGDLPATAGAIVSMVNPVTGTTSGTGAPTDATGFTNVGVTPNASVVFKVSHADDGATIYRTAYDYSHETPATSNTGGAAVFSMRMITANVQSAIAAILGPSSTSLAGLTQFAGSVQDCSGTGIIGATLEYNGAEPNRCSSSATLPCVAYSTQTTRDYSDAGAQVFLLGLPNSGQHTVRVMGIVEEDGLPVQIGELIIRGEGDSIALGAIPAQIVP